VKQLTAFDRWVRDHQEIKINIYHETGDPLKCHNNQCHNRKFLLEETGEYMTVCSNICAKSCNIDVTP